MRVVIFIAATLLSGWVDSTPVRAQEKKVQAEPLITTQASSRLDESWWNERHVEKLSIKNEMKTVDVVLLGDSITHSWETVGKEVWSSVFGDLKTLNLGFSGDRTEHVLWRLQNGEVEGIDPQVVMILIGTNNTGHRLDRPADIAEGIKAIVGELRTRLPRADLLLLGVFPFDEDDQSPRRKNNEAVNAIIGDWHDSPRVQYLNINEHFFNAEGRMTREITPDFLHLSGAGYQIWADQVKGKLRELVQDD